MAALVARSRALPWKGDGDSQGSSPGSVVGCFDLKDIPVEWDNQPAIRERMRNGDNLCVAFDPSSGKYLSIYVDATIENLKANSPVLKPLLQRMAKNELRLPSITNLIEAVSELFTIAKLNRSSEHHYQESWAIRRMIVKLKKFTYRSTPPQDSHGLFYISTDVSLYWRLSKISQLFLLTLSFT